MALVTSLLLGNALLQNLAFEPVLTGPLLYLLLRKPQAFHEHVLRRYPKLDNATLIKVLRFLVVLGVQKKISQVLNRWALNNWQLRTTRSDWQWEKEIVVVTGGCSGFGERVSQELAKKGLNVVILDVQELPKSLQDKSNVHYYKCDVTDPTAVSDVANTIRSEQGHPSILINNAGIANGRTILDTPIDRIRKLFDVNVVSHFYLIKEFLPNMVKENKGHIVSVASMASFISCSNLVDYCGSKAAVLALHEGLAQEIKHRYGAPLIKTSIVHPMWAKTPLVGPWEDQLQKSKTPLLSAEFVGDAIVKQVLSGRSGQIFLPSVMGTVSGMRGWANWLQEHIRDGTAKATGEEVMRASG